jgi:hypothetical protein
VARAAAVDSIFAGTLNASVSIGGSSCVLASTTGIDWGTTSTFAVQVGDDPLTDAELVHVTRSSSTLTLASPSTTFTKAHSAGANVYLIVSAVDLNNKGSKDAANTWDLAQTFTGQTLLQNGTAANPAAPFTGDTDVGPFRVSSNTYGISTGGSERLRVNSGGILVTGSVTPTGALNNGLAPIGTTLNLSLGTTASELEVSDANCTINLPVVAWSRTNTPVYIIKDPNQKLTSCKIYPYDDTFGVFNSINENLTGEQIWSDINSGTTGPDGIYADLTTTGAVWRLSVVEADPGVAVGVGGQAALGGWNLDKLTTGGFT